MIDIEILSKPDCHLCDVAKGVVAQVSQRFPVHVWEVDIRNDPDLEARYRWHIPVVLINGREHFRHRVDPDELQRILATFDTEP